MSTPLTTAEQVIECVQWLERLNGEKEMRDRTDRFHDLFAMRLLEDLPDHVSRGKTRDIPSPFLQELAYDIQAERHSYQTTVTLIALDPKVTQTTNDRIEKWLAMKCAQFLKRWMVQDEGGWHQLVSYAGIAEWEYCGTAASVHDRVGTPNPLSTFFPVTGGPVRPPIMAQRYRALVSDITTTYDGIGFAGDKFTRTGLQGVRQLTDDRPSWNGPTLNGSRFGADCELLKLDYDGVKYHVALHPGQQAEGFLLWHDENRAGPDENGEPAAAAVVLPGMVTPMRAPRDRLLPALMPGIQYTHILNYITTLLATRVENSTGDVLVDVSADENEALANAGNLAATAAQVRQGNPSIIPVAGKPMLWERLPHPDLVKLMDFYSNERDRWANSIREISDPAQLAQINTNVYLPHAAARRQKLAPMNDAMDWGIGQLLRFSVNALQYANKKQTTMYARGGERYGKAALEMDPGEAVSITWDDVKDFEKRFLLVVSTSSISEAERRQMIVDHDDKVLRGYATKRQGIPVAGYADEQSQVEALAEDEAYMAAAAMLAPLVPTTVQERIRLRGGMLIPLGGVIPPAPPPGPVGGQQPYQQPVIPGAQSSSEPGVEPVGAVA